MEPMLRDSGALKLLYQYVKFSIVGVAATATHIAVFASTIELLDLEPMQANLTAFCVAFGVSLLGHRNWTFWTDKPRPDVVATAVRFAGVAAFGLGLNSAVVFLTTETLELPYVYALVPMATLVPISTFLLSRFWAFRRVG